MSREPIRNGNKNNNRGTPHRPLSVDAETDTLSGSVTRVMHDQGYGFIFCPADGKEYFFHVSELENLASIEQVQRGMAARFTGGTGPKGPRATSVTIDE